MASWILGIVEVVFDSCGICPVAHEGSRLEGALVAVQAAETWQARQDHLSEAVDLLSERHHQAGFELPAPAVHPFFDRPFTTTNVEIPAFFVDRIPDDGIQSLPVIRSIEQWNDNVDVLTHPARRLAAGAVYDIAQD